MEQMVNTRQKGHRIERLARIMLEAQGYLVYRVKGTSKWNLNVDIFGLFDILAIKRLVEYTECRLIQIKSNKIYGKELIPFKEFKETYGDAFSVEIWVWSNMGKFKKQLL